jgi:hypothetical protein
MGVLISYPRFRATDENGNPLSGGLLYTYFSGTSTKKSTYQDAAETTPHANPIILDSNGEATIYLANGDYKFVLNNPNATPPETPDDIIWTVDDIQSIMFTTQLFHKTADYTLVSSDMDSGKTFGNKGATGQVVLTLPNGEDNYGASFIVSENQNLKLVAMPGEYFRFGTQVSNTGGYILGAEKGTAWSIKWDGYCWVVTSMSGVLSVDGTTTWTLAATNATSRNIVINGAMEIDQRNAGAAITASGDIDCDRHTKIHNDGAFTAQQVTGDGIYSKARKVTVTTISTLPAADDYYIAEQYRFLGYEVAKIRERTVTISFQFKAKIAGTYCLALRAGDSSLSYVTEFNYPIAEAVTTVSKSIDIPLTGVVTDVGTGLGLSLFIAGMSGGDHRASATDSWVSGNKFSSAGATAWAGTVGNYVTITGLQMELGAYATEFDFRPNELELCYPFCYRIAPASDAIIATGRAANTTLCEFLFTPPRPIVVGPVTFSYSNLAHFATGSVVKQVPSAMALSAGSSLGAFNIDVTSTYDAGGIVTLLGSTSAFLLFESPY